MKPLFKTLLLVVLSLNTTALFATSAAKLVVNDDQSFNLLVNDVTDAFEVSFRDADGTVLHTETVSETTAFASKFDLSYLPQGNYILEVEQTSRIQQFVLAIAGTQVILEDELVLNLMKPTITVREEMIDLNMYSFENDVQINVLVIDAEDKVLVNDSIKGQGHLGRTYDFSALPQGNYEFIASVGGKVFQQALTK